MVELGKGVEEPMDRWVAGGVRGRWLAGAESLHN
jgi:hypothetical protein